MFLKHDYSNYIPNTVPGYIVGLTYVSYEEPTLTCRGKLTNLWFCN